MRSRVFWSIVLDTIWTWIIGGVFAFIGVVEFYFPKIGFLFNWPSLVEVLPWYVWVAVAFFIWDIGFAWNVARRIYIEPPELLKLTEMRTTGIKLRSKIEKLKTKKDVKHFIKEYHEWEQEMLRLVEKLSPSSKESIAHIRDFPILEFPHDVNINHSKHRGIIVTKLTMLENFLADYRRGLSSK